MFVVTGDLITTLDVTLSDGVTSVGWGETLKTKQGSKLTLEIAVTDPEETNAAGRNPSLNRVDVIIGAVSQLGQELQFSLRLCIGLDLEPLRTVDDVLRHPHLDPVFDQVAVEAPGVELLLPL